MAGMQEIKSKVAALLRQPTEFGAERIRGAADNYARLSGPVRSSLEWMNLRTDESEQHIKDYRLTLRELVSLECAAGADAQRCRAIFSCIAELGRLSLAGSNLPIDPSRAVIYAALAGDFSKDHYDAWPNDIPSLVTSERVIYMLMTGKQLSLPTDAQFFDNRHWRELYDAFTRNDAEGVRAALISIANWWLSEYEDAERPVYDPERYPLFESDANAALAIANLREGMNIDFDLEEHKLFYIAARL